MERRGLEARHAVKEKFDEVRLHVATAELLAHREQLVTRGAEHEGGLDSRHLAAGPGSKYTAIVETL